MSRSQQRQSSVTHARCTYFYVVHLLAVVNGVDRETTLADEVVDARVLLYEQLVYAFQQRATVFFLFR